MESFPTLTGPVLPRVKLTVESALYTGAVPVSALLGAPAALWVHEADVTARV